MKKLITVLSFLPFAAFSQINLSSGLGASVNYQNFHAFTEAGYQANFAYFALQGRVNAYGWNKTEIAPVLGIVGHWQNNRLHELSTMAFAKYVIPVIVDQKQTVKPVIAYGIRHHVYNAFIEGCYSDGQVSLTLGWSLKNPFK